MNAKKHFRSDMKSIETPPITRILPHASISSSGKAGSHRIRRAALLSPICIILAGLLVIGAAAITVPMLIGYLNAPVLSENNIHLTTVPEGYTPIYTVADLLAIDKTEYVLTECNCDGECPGNTNYILMNDIVFTDADYAEGGICEGGWKPLENTQVLARRQNNSDPLVHTASVFSGNFNGNGYVIRNLKISSEAESTNDIGLFGSTNGHFFNLGIEDCEINVDMSSNDIFRIQISVGAIAAKAEFIGSCYAKNVSVNVRLMALDDMTDPKYYEYPHESTYESYPTVCAIGGLCGYAQYVDSCYSDAQISIAGGEGLDVIAASVVGTANTIISSLSSGRVTVALNSDKFHAIMTDDICVAHSKYVMPLLIDEDSFNKILAKSEEYYGRDSYSYKKIKAYFLFKKLSNFEDNSMQNYLKQYIDSLKKYGYLDADFPTENGLYVFDPTASITENFKIITLIADAFGGYDAFIAFCHENNVKCGTDYCYYINADQTFTENDLYGLNFEQIWMIKDGKPILLVFDFER